MKLLINFERIGESEEMRFYLGGGQQLEGVWDEVTACRAQHLKSQVDLELSRTLQVVHVTSWTQNLFESKNEDKFDNFKIWQI